MENMMEESTVYPQQCVEYLKKEAEKVDIHLTEAQLQQFSTFYQDLVEKNKVMNLTAITEPGDVTVKHFLDSLSLVRAFTLTEGMKVLDLGTGGGFPGMPLKIANPQVEFVLADSLNKRIKFLNEEISRLSLQKIQAVHGRAEELARQAAHREQYDVVVSRAVANLSTLCEYCLPFVKEGGVFISYKSGDIEEELTNAKHAIRVLGGKCQHVESFMLQENYERTLVVIKKVDKTPKTYPRKAGTPSKQPL